MLHLRFIVCLLMLLGGQSMTWAEPAKSRHVVVICIDGLPAYLFDDAVASMPTIRDLAAKGVRAKGMIVSNPSVTWPNHTSLTTGVRPEKHGVLFNGCVPHIVIGIKSVLFGSQGNGHYSRNWGNVWRLGHGRPHASKDFGVHRTVGGRRKKPT